MIIDADPSSTQVREFARKLKKTQTNRLSQVCLASLALMPYPNLKTISKSLKQKFSSELEGHKTANIIAVMKTLLQYNPDLKKRFYKDQELKLRSDIRECLEKASNNEDEKTIGKVKNPSKSEKRLKKLLKYVSTNLVALQHRPQTKLKRGKSIYEQICGHVNSTHNVIPHYTLSSDSLKLTHNPTRAYNLNQAKISMSEGEKTIHLLVRSGRSETTPRLLKLLQYNFLAALESENRSGITKDKNGNIHFQMALISALDPLPEKAILKTFCQKVRKTGPKAMREIQKNMGILWKDDRPLELKVQGENGKEITFYAEKPILLNFVLSQTATDPDMVEGGRESSHEGCQRLLSLLATNEVLEPYPKLKNLVQDLSENYDERTFDEIAKLRYKEYDATGQKILYALKGVKLTLTGKDWEGKKVKEPYAPAVEALYFYTLIDLLNLAKSVQCKAGCDRAGIFTFLYLAQLHILKTEGKLIDLFDCSDEDHRHFTDEFRTFASKFGLPIVMLSRGSNEFRAKDKPVIPFLFSDTSKENLVHIIPSMKTVAGT